jgi:nucleoside diphosphate kinase
MAEPLVEKTFALIKPDAVSQGREASILQAVELAGFTVITRARVQLTEARAAEFYAEHAGKPFFQKLVAFMSSGPLLAMVLAKEDAIVAWRALMGPTNSLTAKETEPTCLRARFGTDGTQNATHGSDSVASATREIRFFFPKLVMDPMPDAAAARALVVKQLQPTLVKGLTALCKAKPTADKLEAITWIAHWLLDNNPNKPRPMGTGHDGDQAVAAAFQGDLSFGVENEDDESDDGMDIEKLEEELAATRLQAHFRGYTTRKKRAEQVQPRVVVKSHEMFEEDAAATKVQSMYRGHMQRKAMSQMKK